MWQSYLYLQITISSKVKTEPINSTSNNGNFKGEEKLARSIINGEQETIGLYQNDNRFKQSYRKLTSEDLNSVQYFVT